MRAIIPLFLAAAAAFAQDESNVVTISASRQLNIQPDQANLTVNVTTDQTQTLDSVLALLGPAKIDATDFARVDGYGTDQLQWFFTPTVPFSHLSGVTTALSALQAGGIVGVSFYVQGATASQQAVAAQPCPYPALLSDARAQAGKLASAAGVAVGPVVSITQGLQTQAVGGERSGYFVAFLGAQPSTIANPWFSSVLISPQTQPCALTVQFRLRQ